MSKPYNRQWLLNHIRAGAQPKFLFFWSHQPKRPNQTDKSCLSQWFPAPFSLDDSRYETAEHYMMAEKARLFADHKTRGQILAARHPGAAKTLGRQVTPFEPARWEANRCEIVIRGNLAKFSQHAPLGQFLLQTGHRVLVEASPLDTIWGIGLTADDPRANTPEAWPGLNLLGFALMRVRDELAGTA